MYVYLILCCLHVLKKPKKLIPLNRPITILQNKKKKTCSKLNLLTVTLSYKRVIDPTVEPP